jgi:ABC-type dipeptide/oligopeptide/nickel transport system ATPase subunit
MPDSTVVLSLENVGKSHKRRPRDVRVLESVSLRVRCGEVIAVYGQRLSGKTTLALVATGLL